VRDPADADSATSALRRLDEKYGRTVSVLRGDVCREELLVEVEGVFMRDTLS
jgi:hypothetical protein